MKAWRIEKHGGSEVLERKEIAAPSVAPGHVLIIVEAVGLNHLDVWVRKGVPGHKFPLPITPGCDVAGRIGAFGAGAEAMLKGVKVGDPVLVNPGLSCGHCEACLGGFDPLCAEYGILGETTDGGAADLVAVPAANIIPLPKGMSTEVAAALPIPFLTAWTMIFRKLALRPGETILIQAGGSGVSVAAIQMAKMIGAQVITTVGDAKKEALARDLGADHVINYRAGPFREALKKILSAQGKRGVECVIDHVGSDTFGESVKSLAWGGRLACCGATSGSEVALDLKVLFFKNLALHGATMGSKADLLRIVALVHSGKLKPVVDSTRPMAELPAALEKLEARAVFGKIVLKN